jgi:hypothetical protein
MFPKTVSSPNADWLPYTAEVCGLLDARDADIAKVANTLWTTITPTP